MKKNDKLLVAGLIFIVGMIAFVWGYNVWHDQQPENWSTYTGRLVTIRYETNGFGGVVGTNLIFDYGQTFNLFGFYQFNLNQTYTVTYINNTRQSVISIWEASK